MCIVVAALGRRSRLPRRRSRRAPRGVIDTSVLVAGISAFRPRLTHDNKSARLLRDWIDEESFVWLVSDDVLDQYTEVLRRLGVKRSTVGRVVNLLAEAATWVPDGHSVPISPDPGDEPFCQCAESGRADFIATLNLKDFPQARLSARVIAPGDPLPGARSSDPVRRRKK